MKKNGGKSPLLMGYPEIVYSNPEIFRMGHIVYWNMRYEKKISGKNFGKFGVSFIFCFNILIND